MSNMKTIAACCLLALTAGAAGAGGGTAVIVGKKASSTGRVIVGHNEDCEGRVEVRHGWVPAQEWPEGCVMPAEDGMARIPQARRTLGFFWTEMKTPSGGVPNADMFFNERGVLVLADAAEKAGGGAAVPARPAEGGIQYNVLRIVGERATSARDAVRIIGELVERYGHARAGTTYTVADADEAWQVEVADCRRCVPTRCPDDAICVAPRGTRRQEYLESILLGVDRSSGTTAGLAVSPKDVKKALTSHPEGLVPHDDDGESPSACRKATNESLVCEFGETPAETVLDVAGQPPCESTYLSVKPAARPLPAAFDDGDAPGRLARHLLPEPDIFPKPLVVGICEDCSRSADKNQHDYIDALAKVGHIPVVIGRCKDPARIAALLSRIDVLLLAGGEDVHTARYGETRGGSDKPALDRDEFEYLVLGEAVKRRLPVFGICRGMQLMNVFFGGSLYQDIPTEHRPEGGAAPCKHRFGQGGIYRENPPAHEIAIERGTRLHAVAGVERLAVNSHHHQSVKRLAPGFRISARATDGVVEAIEGMEYPAAGVQFHPEKLVACRPEDPGFEMRAFHDILKRLWELCGSAAGAK